jgi:hypothetical protein
VSKNNRSHEDESHVPDAGPEPGESGPLERERAFMEQRFAVLRPREAPPGEPSELPSPDEPPLEGEGEERPLPQDFRQKLMEEYRQRQESTLPPTDTGPPDEAPPEDASPSGTS